ncbi:MAG: diacylglycerol kinase family protein [Acidimicrobiales bacterium]|nr:diacylglycerol kinase family protein [Acidimicrobiales bacterium]
MRILLLVNESASSVTARTRVLIQAALGEHHEVEVALTSRRGHASRLARGAASTGTDLVAVLGGDGTLNEAANGLAGTDCVLAALPGGSTNVFARTIGLDDDPLEATRQTIAAISANSIESVGLGEVAGRYFLFHCGNGFDAAVVKQVERRPAVKRYASHPLFLWAGVDTWLRHYDRSEPRMRVEHPLGTVDDSYLTVVLNTDPYTYLGSRPLSLAPAATLSSGLSVVALRTMEFQKMLALLKDLFEGNPLENNDDLHVVNDLSELSVMGFKPFPYQLDGDYLGEIEQLDFSWCPQILRLVIPAVV